MTDTGVDATCSRCEGDRVDVRVAGGLGELAAARFNRHDRRRKRREGIVGVSGVACTSCGYLELYATDPERLRDP